MNKLMNKNSLALFTPFFFDSPHLSLRREVCAGSLARVCAGRGGESSRKGIPALPGYTVELASILIYAPNVPAGCPR